MSKEKHLFQIIIQHFNFKFMKKKFYLKNKRNIYQFKKYSIKVIK